MSDEGSKNGAVPPTPFAKARHAGMQAFIIAVVVCIGTYALRLTNFGPLDRLVKSEEQAYLKSIPEPLKAHGAVHPLIFVDIDGEALTQWRPAAFRTSCGTDVAGPASFQTPRAAAGTPQRLLAELVAAIRAHAGVIILDIDLRTPQADYEALAQELRCEKAADGQDVTPVLLPHYFIDPAPGCLDKANLEGAGIAEQDTAFDRASARVIPVHSLVHSGGFGMLEGACTAYRVDAPGGWRESMMEVALRLVRDPRAGERHEHETPKVETLRWLIGPEVEAVNTEGEHGVLCYARVRAADFMVDGEVRNDELSWSEGPKPIVILGSTHPGADDKYETPLGRMPGALVQANLGLGMQLEEEPVLSLWWQLLIEVVLLAVGCVLFSVIYYFVRPVSKADEPEGKHHGLKYFLSIPPLLIKSTALKIKSYRVQSNLLPSILDLDHVRQELLSTILTAGTMMLVAVLMFYVIQVVPVQSFLPAWRFGVLSFFLGAVAVAVIEIGGLLKEYPIGVLRVLADPFCWAGRLIFAMAARILALSLMIFGVSR